MTSQGISVSAADGVSGKSLAGAPSDNIPNARAKFGRWSAQFARFAIGQGSLQAVNVISGFLLIRWLSVDSYAKYSLTTGFQGTIGGLAELGLGGSIVALLAGRTEPPLVGRYLRSTKHFRDRFFLALVPVIIVTFSILAHRQGWEWPVIGIVVSAVLFALYFQTSAICHSVPLVIHRKLRIYYQTPTLLGFGRLLLYLILHWISALTSTAAIWVSSLMSAAQAWIYRRNSREHWIEPPNADSDTNREVFNYIRPLIPSTVFYALQGQITILVISWFGENQSIAEIGALGRIGQLFVMLGAFNSVMVAPFIARTPWQMLPARYAQIICGAVVVSLALMGLSLLAPDWLLLLLGDNYRHLDQELAWTMATACIYYLTGVMWTIHSAKKWVFSWTAWVQIGAVLSTQICGVIFMDLSTTQNVLAFSLFSAIAAFAVHILWGIYGFFIYEPRARSI